MTTENCRCDHDRASHGTNGYRCQYKIHIKRGHPIKQCGCVEFVSEDCEHASFDDFHAHIEDEEWAYNDWVGNTVPLSSIINVEPGECIE